MTGFIRFPLRKIASTGLSGLRRLMGQAGLALRKADALLTFAPAPEMIPIRLRVEPSRDRRHRR
ncbi:hypothetical protein [Paenirhodobacter populi]|uniref:Uncharacterized protein n=1 Tax=Paenirhodobacter populi TaxID=2306993 RepID=A0A443JAK9_9RHOB|nr:hypothetical protein [Sinirhodobacter populi]RWR06457.1 hypothetical protein D2T32_14230 [Sinirhodobacter populi]RWR17565.1 hypothetical protein D2T30_18545 [Sinirhodobacter populi]RWR29007.1 hypothetical protein D2T29_15620 [Sinirhodobacter populi]